MISSIGDWLKLVMLAGFVGGGLSYLLPESKTRLKDYLNLSVALLLLLILITPIVKLLTGKDDFNLSYEMESAQTKSADLFDKVLIFEADALFKERLQDYLKTRFPASKAYFEPVYSNAENAVQLDKLYVYNAGKEKEEIIVYFQTLLQTEVISCE